MSLHNFVLANSGARTYRRYPCLRGGSLEVQAKVELEDISTKDVRNRSEELCVGIWIGSERRNPEMS